MRFFDAGGNDWRIRVECSPGVPAARAAFSPVKTPGFHGDRALKLDMIQIAAFSTQSGRRHSPYIPKPAKRDEEAHEMQRTGTPRTSSWRTSPGRIAAVAVAVGGLSALAFAPTIAAAATSPTTASVISTTNNAKLGTILVAGDAVYTLKASKTACTAKCLKAWPPVLLPQGVTTATAATGVDASKLGTVAATGGALQITYSGKALYWFAKDKSPGQVKGHVKDKWGKWSTVVAVKSSSASSTTNATATTPAPTTTAPSTPQPAPAQTSPPQTSPSQTDPPPTSPPAPRPTTPPATSPSTGGTAF